METKALEILREMIGRRGLDTTVQRLGSPEGLDPANAYTIGNILVIFSQKAKVVERDIRVFVGFAEASDYKNGVIIVSLSKPSENVLKVVKSLAKDRIQFFWIWHLQHDWTTHRYYVPHRILKEDEKTKLYKDLKISKPEEQLPWIDSQDYGARVVGATPGDVIEILRHSDVAGYRPYYRYCVEDVNVA